MTSTDRQADGGRALFWLSVLILGGLLFAAGVMVGRSMAPPAAAPPDTLARLDQHAAKLPADDQLTFPKALSGPPVRPPEPAAGSKTAAAPEPRPAARQEPQKPPPRPEPAAKEEPGPAAPSGQSYCLQVASFREQGQAEQLVEQLRAKGLPEVRFVSGEVPGRGLYYRVRLGRFADRPSAERFGSEHALEGLVIQSEE